MDDFTPGAELCVRREILSLLARGSARFFALEDPEPWKCEDFERRLWDVETGFEPGFETGFETELVGGWGAWLFFLGIFLLDFSFGVLFVLEVVVVFVV